MYKQPPREGEDIDRALQLVRETGRKAARKRRPKGNGVDRALPAFTEEALALSFAETHAGSLRHVAAWGKWLSFDGSRWCLDDTLFAFSLVRVLCREAACNCNEKNITVTLASAKTIAAVERLAKSDRRIAATIEQWDADPWLLNTPQGIVDLRTGQTESHRADAYMTKITRVAPDRSFPTPLWSAVIDRATGKDKALAGYLQRLFGYALTGSTREHSLHFAYGTGANSKGTIINTIAECMGDYHTAAPIETFTASMVDRHPTELADLHGARMVTATETEEGRRWAESRIKTLTGGDRIKARFMRQDFFWYVPQFTLIIMGNHRPGLRSVDEAIRRRFHLVPFTVTIPPHERDNQLPEKLKAEWPGILQWQIDGCLEWQRHGLAAPQAVTSATADYLEAQDTLAAWIEECIEEDPKAWESRAALFESWSNWASASSEHIGTRATFLGKLERRFEPQRQPGTGSRGFRGLRLKRPAQQAPYWDC
jgi:putative DNA primase/helicase